MTQTDEDARRYAKFDLPAKIIVTGNTKIEAARTDSDHEDPIRPGADGVCIRSQNFYCRDRLRLARTP